MPTGAIAPVAGTPFDFRAPTALGARIRTGVPQLAFAKGYDHNFVLRGGVGGAAPRRHREDPSSGRRMEVSTTQPGLQLYTGNNLDGTLTGTSGRLYRSGDAVCFETQGFPDAPNRPDFPSTVLRPGECFQSTTLYRFSPRRDGEAAQARDDRDDAARKAMSSTAASRGVGALPRDVWPRAGS